MFGLDRPAGYTPHHIYYDPHAESVRRLLHKAEGKTDEEDVLQAFTANWAEQTRHMRCRRRNKATGRLILLLVLALTVGFLLIS